MGKGKSTKTRREIFIHEYIIDYNGARAARVAGYSDSTAGVVASQLLKDKKIIKAVERARNEAIKRSKITLDEVISILANIVRADPAQLMDSNGNMRKIQDMPRGLRDAIQDIEAQGHYLDGELAGVTHKVKIASKLRAAETLLRVLGGFEQDNKQKRPDPVILSLNPLGGGIKLKAAKERDPSTYNGGRIPLSERTTKKEDN